DHDGETFIVDSAEQHPRHVLDASTTVALRVTDTLGAVSDVVTREVTVVGPTSAAFSPLPDTGLGDVARAEHGGDAVLWSSPRGTPATRLPPWRAVSPPPGEPSRTS